MQDNSGKRGRGSKKAPKSTEDSGHARNGEASFLHDDQREEGAHSYFLNDMSANVEAHAVDGDGQEGPAASATGDAPQALLPADGGAAPASTALADADMEEG